MSGARARARLSPAPPGALGVARPARSGVASASKAPGGRRAARPQPPSPARPQGPFPDTERVRGVGGPEGGAGVGGHVTRAFLLPGQSPASSRLTAVGAFVI